jgi:hypothetical protein
MIMRTLIFSSLLIFAGACDRDTIRDGANTARDRVGSPTDLSTTGQPVPPSGTFGTGDGADRNPNLPGTADTGGMRGTSGFATSGPMGTGGPGYTTGTTGVAGNQGIPTTQRNPDVGRTDTKDLDKSMGATHHSGDARADATERVQSADSGRPPRAIDDMTGRASGNIGPSDNPREGANDTPGINGGNSSTAGTGSTTTLGDTGGDQAGAVTAQNTKKPATKKRTSAVRQ